MPELVFHTGPMDCGKSTLALQLDHTQSTHGRQSRIFTSRDRSGRARISSRLGLETPATEVDEEFDFWTHVIAQLVAGRRIDYLVCDEAQFYTGEQVAEGRKSLAFALRLRGEATLTAEETARVRKRVLKAARKAFGAELRA